MIIGNSPIQRRGKHHLLDIKCRAIDLWMDKEYDGDIDDYILSALKEHRESLSNVEIEQQPATDGIWSKDSLGWYQIDK